MQTLDEGTQSALAYPHCETWSGLQVEADATSDVYGDGVDG